MKVKQIPITECNRNSTILVQLILTPKDIGTMRLCLNMACERVSQSGGEMADDIRKIAKDFRPALDGILW